MIDNYYVVYRENECLLKGTKKQIEEELNVKTKILQYTTDPNKKRYKGKRIRLVLTK